MSKAGYQFNSFKIFIIEYSFDDHGEVVTYKRSTPANSEEEALEDAKKNLLVSSYPSFSMKIIGHREYGTNN